MLSMANVRSSSAAASYFAADNYYARADADRSGQWLGDGARRLGLEGRVETARFDALLRGELPNGSTVGNAGQAHRPGTDLTFSLPKSWSLLALVGKDGRIIQAYREAVIEALGWAEKSLAETRTVARGEVRTVATGNLAVALFQHDTNRSQEPNLHFHAVIANVTQGQDGKWRTLKNDRLWQHNTLLNAIAMARFRVAVEKLGYAPGPVLQHGNFEASGISREQVMAFSSRRKEVLAARRGPGLEAGRIAALDTRSAKATIEDRSVLAERWDATAKEAGLDLRSLVDSARLRSEAPQPRENHTASLVSRGLGYLRDFADRIRGNARDPLIPEHILKREPGVIAAAQAVASATRHLSQREAAFERTALYKAALDFGLPTTIGEVEKAVQRLVGGGALVAGKGTHAGCVASREALETETRILAWANEGRGAVKPVLVGKEARERVQAAAGLNHGIRLNEGQVAAAELIITSEDRTVAVEGVAGAGKSSVLAPVAAVLREEGREIIGLAVQNTLVQMLERDTGIRSMTLARFLGNWRPLLENPTQRNLLSKAQTELGGHVLVLDEASMVANDDKERLVRLANLAGVDRLVLMGDRKQLGAVDAGKPFALLQEGGLARAEMPTNLRGRDPTLRKAQAAAQAGHVREALSHLQPSAIETNGDGAIVAAEQWLSLGPADRERTAIYASGRRLRAGVNEAVQRGLLANGEIGPETIALKVLDRVNLTREELRYLSSYRTGLVLEVSRTERALGLKRGEYTVAEVDERKGVVMLQGGRGERQRLSPTKLRSKGHADNLALFEQRDLEVHRGDRIRWTRNDHDRGLLNADRATVVEIERDRVTIETSQGVRVELRVGDPMLRRIDLAYALNAHMAQGLTSDRGIAVMDSRERNLANQKTFLVTVTRLRDHLTLIVDSSTRLRAAVARNRGEKASALEATDRLRVAAAKGLDSDQLKTGGVAPERELSRSQTKALDFGI